MIRLSEIYPIRRYFRMIKNILVEGTVKAPTTNNIVRAIQNRMYVGIYYSDPTNDVLPGFRMIEPYAFGSGYRKKDGEVINNDKQYLRAYIILDTSKDPTTKKRFGKDRDKRWLKRKSKTKSGKILGWRLFRVDRIKTWQNLERKFKGNRALYNPNDKTMGTVIASVSV